jgi:hypothetical protein
VERGAEAADGAARMFASGVAQSAMGGRLRVSCRMARHGSRLAVRAVMAGQWLPASPSQPPKVSLHSPPYKNTTRAAADSMHKQRRARASCMDCDCVTSMCQLCLFITVFVE